MGGLVMGHGFGLRMIEGHIYIYTHIQHGCSGSARCTEKCC